MKCGGVWAIEKERRRQVEDLEWSSEHDDQYAEAELARAAVCYILKGIQFRSGGLLRKVSEVGLALWPWDAAFWKPKDRRADLVLAGALIAAEIARHDRAEARRARSRGACDLTNCMIGDYCKTCGADNFSPATPEISDCPGRVARVKKGQSDV